MYRRTVREQIFKLLFRAEFNNAEEMPEQEKLFFQSGDQTYTDEDREEISGKFEKIYARIPDIDKRLAAVSTNWDISRIGKVELTILRLAVYEIEEDDTVPEKVAINEAVELARKFGQENGPRFVNAVLASFTEEGRQKAADKAAAAAEGKTTDPGASPENTDAQTGEGKDAGKANARDAHRGTADVYIVKGMHKTKS